MAKKTKTKPVNAPIRVWMMDILGGYIEVSNLYLWVHLRPHQRKLQYRIDGKRLWEQLKHLNGPVPVADLEMSPSAFEGEKTVVFETPDEQEFQFSFEVSLEDLKDAVCVCRKF